MRDAHVFMPPNIRQAVDSSQRLPVTEFRENTGMPKPPGMPDHRHTIGARVRWWREHRHIPRAALAKKVGYSTSGLSDLELGRSTKSERLHLIAAELRLNAHYIETGYGEPEAGFAQEPPSQPDEWPFPAVPQSRLKRYNRIERSYVETKLVQALNEIEAVRRNKNG